MAVEKVASGIERLVSLNAERERLTSGYGEGSSRTEESRELPRDRSGSMSTNTFCSATTLITSAINGRLTKAFRYTGSPPTTRMA